MKLLYGLLMGLCVSSGYAQTTTYFEQNFSSSSNVADYKGGGTNKFTEILGNTPSTTGINNEALTLTKASGGQVRFAKTDDLFSANPTILYVQFTVSVDITEPSAAVNPYNYLYFGNLNDNGSLPTNASVFARLGFHFPTAGNSFNLHLQDGGSVTKGPYTGTKTITWVLNVSGNPTTYTDEDGRTGTLAANKMDIWVDNSLEFDEASELSTGVSPTDFKFLWNNSNGTLTVDNLKILGSQGPMPVELLYFKAVASASQVRLNWATASEKNARSFVVERSTDAEQYEVLETYKASGTTNERKEYRGVDENPLPGKSYYRLRQIDEDGTEYVCRTVSVERPESAELDIQILGNPLLNAQQFTIRTTARDVSYELYTHQGEPIPMRVTRADGNQDDLQLQQGLRKGLYLLRATQAKAVVTRRIVVE
ncbi:hypothetical protein [Siphonobacter sp.]|uniref:hypothetical protein n=1 Tax=Siphonobacter sp. TaxID=1869184 RepID=UPI003B3B8FE6